MSPTPANPDCTAGLPLFDQAGLASPKPGNPRRHADREKPEAFHRIWRALLPCWGEENARTAADLAEACGLWPELSRKSRGRRLREVIEVHLDEFPWPVAATPSRDGGYYLASTPEEIGRYEAQLQRRAGKMWRRIAATRRQALAVGFERQHDGTWAAPAGGVRRPQGGA